jgi:hypothetical protein
MGAEFNNRTPVIKVSPGSMYFTSGPSPNVNPQVAMGYFGWMWVPKLADIDSIGMRGIVAQVYANYHASNISIVFGLYQGQSIRATISPTLVSSGFQLSPSQSASFVRCGAWNHIGIAVVDMHKMAFIWNGQMVTSMMDMSPTTVVTYMPFTGVYVDPACVLDTYFSELSQASWVLVLDNLDGYSASLPGDVVVLPGVRVRSQVKDVYGYMQNYGVLEILDTLTLHKGYRSIGDNARLTMTLERDSLYLQEYLMGERTVIDLTVPLPSLPPSSSVKRRREAVYTQAFYILINVTGFSSADFNYIFTHFVLNYTIPETNGTLPSNLQLQQDPVTGSIVLAPPGFFATPSAPPSKAPMAPIIPDDNSASEHTLLNILLGSLLPVPITLLLGLIVWLLISCYRRSRRYTAVVVTSDSPFGGTSLYSFNAFKTD